MSLFSLASCISVSSCAPLEAAGGAEHDADEVGPEAVGDGLGAGADEDGIVLAARALA